MLESIEEEDRLVVALAGSLGSSVVIGTSYNKLSLLYASILLFGTLVAA